MYDNFVNRSTIIDVYKRQVHDNVGIGAIVLDGAKIGAGSIVAAGSLVPPDKEFPDGMMIMGSPARAVRTLTAREKEYLKHVTTSYTKMMQVYKEAEKIL